LNQQPAGDIGQLGPILMTHGEVEPLQVQAEVGFEFISHLGMARSDPQQPLWTISTFKEASKGV
jgi:hypothetical protein